MENFSAETFLDENVSAVNSSAGNFSVENGRPKAFRPKNVHVHPEPPEHGFADIRIQPKFFSHPIFFHCFFCCRNIVNFSTELEQVSAENFSAETLFGRKHFRLKIPPSVSPKAETNGRIRGGWSGGGPPPVRPSVGGSNHRDQTLPWYSPQAPLSYLRVET